MLCYVFRRLVLGIFGKVCLNDTNLRVPRRKQRESSDELERLCSWSAKIKMPLFRNRHCRRLAAICWTKYVVASCGEGMSARSRDISTANLN